MQTDKEFLRERTITSLYSESTGEYSLPDYNTDIRKLLLVKAQPIPSGRFLDGENLELSGIIYYSIVYLDFENEITHCEFTSDFDIRIKCDSDNYVDSDITTQLSNFSLRLVGPRKISVKASLHSDIHIIERDGIGIEGDTFDGREPETALSTARIAYRIYSENTEREYAEELVRLDGVIADEVDVLLCTCEPKISSINKTEEGIEYKGELLIDSLIKVEDTYPTVHKKSVPFTETVAFSELEEGMIPKVKLVATSVKCTVNPDDDGVSVAVSVIVDARAEACANESVDVVMDCYLQECDVVNEYGEFAYTETLGVQNGDEIFLYEMPREESEGKEIRNILFASATPKIDSEEFCDGVVKITGTIRFSGIACEVNEDGAPEYNGIKYDVPFCHNVNCCCQIPEKIKPEVHLFVTDPAITLDPVKMHFEAKIQSEVTLSADKKQRCVTASSVSDTTYVKDESSIVVYYPSVTESLFDVAKKFHTSVLALAEDNSLAESVFSSAYTKDSLQGVKKLIIK